MTPSFIKVYGEGDLFGDGCFTDMNPELKRLNTAVAIDEKSDTVLIRFKSRTLYETVVVDNRKWSLENKSLFFHASIPCLNI